MNSNDLQNIVYPIYKLPAKPLVDDGVTFYYGETEVEGEPNKQHLKILDDKNIEGDSLASRRLKLLASSAPLFRLSKAIFFLGDLIKEATSSTYFIDANGMIFNYVKTTTAKLKFHKINKVLQIPTGGAIIEVLGIPNRFKVINYPTPETKCAGVLHIGISTILYGLYEYIPEDTVRRV